MPNGHDRAWVRLCITINGFRARYGAWPTIVRYHPIGLQVIREQLLDTESLAILEKQFELIADDSVSIRAEDEAGRQVTYGETLSLPHGEDLREWLGIDAIPEDVWERQIATKQAAGWETGQFGQWLGAQLDSSSRYQLFYDHGERATDPHVAALKGFAGETVSNLNRLADIDLLLASPAQEARLLIEIEERPLSPKKLLGDIFALLLCTRVAVGRGTEQQYFRITPATHLVVAGIVPTKGQQRAKFATVLLPRLRQVSGPPGGIRLDNVSLILGDSPADMIARLQAHVLPFIA